MARRRRDFLMSVGGLASALMTSELGCERAPASPRKPRPKAAARSPWGDPPAPPSFAEAAAAGSDALPDGLDPRDFTLYSRTPLTLETRRGRIGGGLTDAARLFVRNNLPMPNQRIVDDADAWVLRVLGVEAERRFTLRELKALGEASVVSVLQCSGNGRRFFPHGPSGSPWGVGAAGCVRWTGVPVAAVLAAVGGPRSSARFLTATGGDPMPTLPPGIDPSMLLVERSVPLEKGLRDCILAWELGGAPLPLTHGGPLRLIVPGYYGVNSVKYITTLACTAAESPARIQQTSYRVRPVGERGAASQPSMWRMPVSSWIHSPGGDQEPLVAGPARVRGVAFSGERGVARVEVSIDDGATWRDADLDDDDLGVNAWRPFSLEVELAVGVHRLIARATDTAGDRQPELRADNERGYGNTSWRDFALEVEAFADADAAARAAEERQAAARAAEEARVVTALSDRAERGREVFVAEARPACGNCHTFADAGAGMTIGPDLDALGAPLARVENAVTNGVGVMQGYRDQLTTEQIDAVARYVVEAAGNRRP